MTKNINFIAALKRMKALFWLTIAFFLAVLIFQTSTYLGREGFANYITVYRARDRHRNIDWAQGPWWWHQKPYWWHRYDEYGPCPGPWCPYR